MSARILVVDDIAANVRLLEAKLHSEYYEVITATSGKRALDLVRDQFPDIVLLDVMMPGMDGFQVCREIKRDPHTAHIPVVMVTALNDIRDRVEGLKAGADDFLSKPTNDVILLARIRSLVRMKRAGDEWRTRESTLRAFGGEPCVVPAVSERLTGKMLLAMDLCDASQMVEEAIKDEGHELFVARSCDEAADLVRNHEFELVLVDAVVAGQDALRLCSLLRSLEVSRHVPILFISDDGNGDRLAKALEIGVSDYLIRPIVCDELVARTRTQVRRKLYEDGLRRTFERRVRESVQDSLTGLHNRRYLAAHYEGLERELIEGSKQISLLMLDIDHFKQVNDSYGHLAGDEILKGVAQRIQTALRGFDTAARFGGEEFAVLLPNTPVSGAMAVAERLRNELGVAPYAISEKPGQVGVTVSIGVATVKAGSVTLEGLIGYADAALYEAKNSGRNRSVAASNGISAPADIVAPKQAAV